MTIPSWLKYYVYDPDLDNYYEFDSDSDSE